MCRGGARAGDRAGVGLCRGDARAGVGCVGVMLGLVWGILATDSTMTQINFINGLLLLRLKS